MQHMAVRMCLLDHALSFVSCLRRSRSCSSAVDFACMAMNIPSTGASSRGTHSTPPNAMNTPSKPPPGVAATISAPIATMATHPQSTACALPILSISLLSSVVSTVFGSAGGGLRQWTVVWHCAQKMTPGEFAAPQCGQGIMLGEPNWTSPGIAFGPARRGLTCCGSLAGVYAGSVAAGNGWFGRWRGRGASRFIATIGPGSSRSEEMMAAVRFSPRWSQRRVRVATRRKPQSNQRPRAEAHGYRHQVAPRLQETEMRRMSTTFASPGAARPLGWFAGTLLLMNARSSCVRLLRFHWTAGARCFECRQSDEHLSSRNRNACDISPSH